MKGTIKVLNQRGHTEVAYDTEKGVVEEAERILREAASQRAVLFSGTTKEKIANAHEVMTGGGGRALLEEHEQVLVVPPMQGGC